MRAALMGALLVIAGSAPSVGAESVATGQVAFSGTVFLSQFPCPPGNSCSGTLVGSLRGFAAGRHDGVAWSVTAPLADLSATFFYNDFCLPLPDPLPDVPPPALTGSAAGSGTVAADLNGGQMGTYGPASGPGVPFPVTGLAVAFGFDWARATTVAHMTFADDIWIEVTKPGGPEWIQVTDDQAATGVATFTPTTVPLPNCASPGPLTGLIAGSHTIG